MQTETELPTGSDGGTPRRIRMDRWIPAERAIHDAVAMVEMAGADVRLTRAVILLGRARDLVADFVDGVVPEPAGPISSPGRRPAGGAGKYSGPLTPPFEVYEDYERGLHIIDGETRYVLQDTFAYDGSSDTDDADARMEAIAQALNVGWTRRDEKTCMHDRLDSEPCQACDTEDAEWLAAHAIPTPKSCGLPVELGALLDAGDAYDHRGTRVPGRLTVAREELLQLVNRLAPAPIPADACGGCQRPVDSCGCPVEVGL